MELVTQRLIVKSGQRVPVIPVGDIQWAGATAKQTALEALKQTIARGVDLGAWFVLTGDAVDFASPSNRARLDAANLYDTAADVIAAKANALVEELFEVALKPSVGRWLGIVAGHHYYKFPEGDTTDMRLARLLKTRFLGDCALIRLEFVLGKKTWIPGIMWVHHGAGAGQTGYYPLLRLEKVAAAWEEVDVFVVGHTCKSAHEYAQKLRARWATLDLTHRKIILVGAGGYAKTYVEGHKLGNIPSGTYAEKRMLSPVIVGSPTIWWEPRRRRFGSGGSKGDTISLTITAEA